MELVPFWVGLRFAFYIMKLYLSERVEIRQNSQVFSVRLAGGYLKAI